MSSNAESTAPVHESLLDNDEHECTIVSRAGPDDHARWAAQRACWRHGRHPRPGTGVRVQAALRRAHGHTLLCRAQGCHAMVDLQAARAAARKGGRGVLNAGDGCASRVCSAHFCAGRFARTQIAWAEKLISGERQLLLWPPSAAGGIDLYALPRARALAKASEVLAHGGARGS